jgi:hypothetical protein
MATTFTEIWDGRGAKVDDSAQVRRVRQWRGINQTITTSDKTVIDDFTAATGIRRWTTWVGADGATDPSIWAVNILAEQQEEPIEWRVRVEYSNERTGGAGGFGGGAGGGGGGSPRQQREKAAMARQGIELGEQPQENPTLRPPVVRWGDQEYEEALEYDMQDGRAITNSAKERFIPPPTRTLSFLTLTIERNEPLQRFDPRDRQRFKNRVNANEFYRFPAHSVLCKSITADLAVESRIVFWVVSYTFWIKYEELPDGRVNDWRLEVIDKGYNELAGGKLMGIFESRGGVQVPVERWLNGAGLVQPTDLGPIYLPKFSRYPLVDFTPLGL